MKLDLKVIFLKKKNMIKVLKYAHIARHSRLFIYRKNEISRNIVEILENVSRKTV